MMWTKLSNALKQRPQESDHDHDPSDVMSKVYEQHPNLSHFHEPVSRVAFPTSSPRNGVFRRSSSKGVKDEGDGFSPSKLGISLPKKVKSSLALNMNFSSSQASLANRPSCDSPRPSYDTARPSVDVPRSSTSLAMRTPQTPTFDGKNAAENSASVRSILRDPKTPGTGQNVRFFSRDAYKVITPDASMVTNTDQEDHDMKEKEMGFMDEAKDLAFMERLQRASPDSSKLNLKKRPSVADVFEMMTSSSPAPVFSKESSPVFTKESTPFIRREATGVFTSPVFTPPEKPLPQPDLSHFFDTSQDRQLPTIPVGFDVPLLDNAVELAEDTSADSHGAASTPQLNAGYDDVFHIQDRSLERSKSFSFGQTIFHSMNKSTSSSPMESKRASASSTSSDNDLPRPVTPVDPPPRSDSLPKRGKSRSRALSDSMFQTMIRASNNNPEADINDQSTSGLVVYATPEPDPFSAHATTYYTPQTMIPVTPPQHQQKERHTRAASAEENVIWNLRTQLALQQELCAQFEIDLGARDELVETLSAKLSTSEKADEKRRGTLKSWKKKVAELEKTLRSMEEEVERSREMSMERSVMDEASGEALRMLHRQIGKLERERGEWEMKEKKMQEELRDLKGLLKGREESERELREGIRDAQDQIEMMGVVEGNDWRATMIMKERESEEERERHRLKEFEWEEEKARLVTKQSDMSQGYSQLREQMEILRGKEEHFDMLKSELEAQWQHTEVASEKNASLEKEREGLKDVIELLEQKTDIMKVELNESQNQRIEMENEVQEIWEHKEMFEKEREKAEEQLRAESQRVSELEQTLQEREDRITELDHSHRYALDSLSRLEDNLRQREAELAECSQRVAQREAEADQFREQISTLNRDHTRIVDAQARELQDLAGREGEARQHQEMLVKEKAELDVLLVTLKERSGALQEEVERLRRQVHELQQESADKEVKIVHLTKSRAQDKEDMAGLNIALDSKQQELELVKRRLGVRGTAGSTPAQPSKIAHHRRDSSVPSTPGVQRPPSAMSDTENIKNSKRSETSSSVTSFPGRGVSALGKSVRINGPTIATASTGSMGPPSSKPRSSVVGTPTPTMTKRPSGSLSRSTISRPSGQPISPSSHLHISQNLERKPMSSTGRQPPNMNPPPSEDEKENIVAEKSVRRRSMLPIPA